MHLSGNVKFSSLGSTRNFAVKYVHADHPTAIRFFFFAMRYTHYAHITHCDIIANFWSDESPDFNAVKKSIKYKILS